MAPTAPRHIQDCMQPINRVARPALDGTCLHGILTACVGLEERALPAIHVPAQPSTSLRLLATVDGSAMLEAEGRNVQLTGGSLAVLVPGWGYRRRVNRERWHVHALLIAGPWSERLVAACAPGGGALVVSRPPPAWRNWLVEAVARTMDQRPLWDFAVAARLADLTTALCARPGDGLAERTLALLRADPRRTWTVGGLARVHGLGGSAFAHRFTAEIGEPPLRWLRRQRIAMASQLLAKHPPGAVAGMLGFATPFHFSRVFRQQTGMPPSRWRARLVEADEGI